MFRDKHKPGDTEVRFTREELLSAAGRVGVRIRNLGDFPYHYSKRGELPEPIQQAGFQSLEVVGHSVYAFTKASDSIEIPPDLPEREIPLALSAKVRRHVTDDEQGMLVKVRESNLLSDFLGEKVFHLQGHLRTESNRNRPARGEASSRGRRKPGMPEEPSWVGAEAAAMRPELAAALAQLLGTKHPPEG